jgi:hypothetical protein
MQSNLSVKSRVLESLRFKLRIDTISSRPNYILSRMQIKKLVQVVKFRKASSEIKLIVQANTGVPKEAILQLVYRGVLVGDLFYDWHLSKRGLPTLDTHSIVFKMDLTEFLIRAKAWDKFLQKNKVEMIVVTHAVYLQGIVVRFGSKFKAKVFLVTHEKLHQLSEEMFLADSEWIYYNTNQEFKLGHPRNIENSRRMLGRLQEGSKKVDVAHSFVNGMAGDSVTQIIVNKSRVKVLIAAHCFSDSPHTNGLHLFPDFVEWLNWLGEFSLSTDYEWYVKQHPAFFPSDYGVLEDFCRRYPNIKLVEHTYSNVELVKQGINVVLTVYGTIAFEAASLGCLVINASSASPHANFDFSISPSCQSDYYKTLTDLENVLKTWKINELSILHFYDIHHLRRNFNWLFQDDYSTLATEQGIDFGNPLELFNYFISQVAQTDLQNKIQLCINDFIASSDYVIGRIE